MKNNSVYEIEDILDILPHRQPFLLIDRVLELNVPASGGRVGRTLKAIKNVTYNEQFFAGHFPHRPVMPGVLIVEAMAQAAALACFSKADPKVDLAIAKVSEFRIRRPVVPGDQLVIDVHVLKEKGGMVLVACKSTVNSELVTDFELMAAYNFIKGKK